MQLNLGSGFLVYNGSIGDTGAHRPASYGSNGSLGSAHANDPNDQRIESFTAVDNTEPKMEQNMLNKYMQENESLRSDILSHRIPSIPSLEHTIWINKTYLYFWLDCRLKTNNELIILF